MIKKQIGVTKTYTCKKLKIAISKTSVRLYLSSQNHYYRALLELFQQKYLAILEVKKILIFQFETLAYEQFADGVEDKMNIIGLGILCQ